MSDGKQPNERFYWLKLKKDFFKRHDIKVIEGMENGKDYVLFYLKLLCESLDHNGNLRFSDTIPYSESMLASVTGTNIDVVRSAMKILVSLNLVEVLDDQTIFMREVEKMTGSETASTIRSRECRLRQSEAEMLQRNKMQQIATQENRDKSIDNIYTTPTESILLVSRAHEDEKTDTRRSTWISKINAHLRKNCHLGFYLTHLNNCLKEEPKLQSHIDAINKVLEILYQPSSKSDLDAVLQLSEDSFVKLVNKFIDANGIEDEKAYVWTSVYNALKENNHDGN